MWSRDLWMVGACYALALVFAGVFARVVMSGDVCTDCGTGANTFGTLVMSLLADVVGTCIVFAFSYTSDNSR
ncbi:hypothetical protein KIPB_015241 [Kipferlia bialata]|uniref:Uncharacterized protein n=1 Tax=Kipferlia bialata TaxID=797122 RepID=A0A391NU84_9EUKA|nr:hypothetical protein KIPB_015241 [Kipferlia bialata]|eukprot:g15241.t1